MGYYYGDDDDTCVHGNVTYGKGDCAECDAEDQADEDAEVEPVRPDEGVESDKERLAILADEWHAQNEQPSWMQDEGNVYDGSGYDF